MPIDLTPALTLASRYKLASPVQPLRGLAGDHLSKGVGSSVEFQDFRHYVPGDDPRYIDWAAVARTDQLILRLHRAEVQLSADILLDVSRSLGIDGGVKGERSVQSAFLLSLLARKGGARTTVWALGDAAIPMREVLEKQLAGIRFEGRVPFSDLLQRNPPRLEPGSVRFLIGDFLFPHDPMRLQQFVARGAGGGAFLQVLTAWERDPSEEGHVRLMDVETGEERPMAVTAETVRGYRERLGGLREGLAASCRAAHLPYALLSAEQSLESSCHDVLVKEGILEPI